MTFPFLSPKKPKAEKKGPPKKELVFLVVEDAPTMRRTLNNMLRSIGYKRMVEADDGDTALSKLRTTPVDFIICDWIMPRMPGVELLRKLRDDPALRDIPFLMITGEGSEAQVARAAEEEVDGYMVKPFVAVTLEQKIKAILQKKAKPPEEEVHIKLGTVYKDGEMYDKALVEFEKARELKPNSARISLCIGEVHEAMGEADKAEQFYLESASFNPSYIKVHHKLSDFYMKRNDYEKAMGSLQQAATISPNNAERQVALGKIHLKKGNKEEGMKALAFASELDPKNATMQYEIGEVYLENGLEEKAATTFRHSLSLSEDVHVYNRLGIALRRKNRYKEAIDEYRKALVVEPDNEGVHYNLGRALIENGQKSDARDAFKKALEIDPEFEECKKMLKELGGSDDGYYGSSGSGGGSDYGGYGNEGTGTGGSYGDYYSE